MKIGTHLRATLWTSNYWRRDSLITHATLQIKRNFSIKNNIEGEYKICRSRLKSSAGLANYVDMQYTQYIASVVTTYRWSVALEWEKHPSHTGFARMITAIQQILVSLPPVIDKFRGVGLICGPVSLYPTSKPIPPHKQDASTATIKNMVNHTCKKQLCPNHSLPGLLSEVLTSLTSHWWSAIFAHSDRIKWIVRSMEALKMSRKIRARYASSLSCELLKGIPLNPVLPVIVGLARNLYRYAPK